MKKPFLTLPRLLALAALLLGAAPAFADGPPAPGPAAADSVPLDGGASLLLAAGVGIGLRKLRRRKAGAG